MEDEDGRTATTRRGRRGTRAASVACVLLVGLLAGCGADGDADAQRPAITLADVRVAAARTRGAGTAHLRATSSGRETDGVWDFARRQGRFTGDAVSGEVVVANGAVFRRLSRRELAGQGDEPAARHRWSQTRVPTTADVEDDRYFGLALEGPATLDDAFDVLALATSVEDLGRAGAPVGRGARLGLPDALTREGYRTPEVWLDAGGRIRRLHLAAAVGPGPPRIDLTLDVGPFAVPADVAVPPVADLDPSGEVVPVAAWRVVDEADAAGRRYHLLVAPDNRSYDRPERRTGRCVAVTPADLAPAAPPPFYDCMVPAAPGLNPVLLAQAVHPSFQGDVMTGTAVVEWPSIEAAFDGGPPVDVAVHDGAFAVVVPEGRHLRTLAGTPVDQLG
ncbi:MAG TPA: hypothetical protein VHM89_10375 [Acidimicrobiales bacterium]|nr:hypothetical protein [Acidimicrobiales bacterium]